VGYRGRNSYLITDVVERATGVVTLTTDHGPKLAKREEKGIAVGRYILFLPTKIFYFFFHQK
jgi:hypothetical protein